ncbi:MAG: HAMP domain-containing histidine kinase [Deltaproteobacteria bacterium]|nr:HAMP domain-containing histidine kinase [Deltaproteobacteria bacterium]
MNVRQKITLLITAAGFLSSLVFSCIISWEMFEQPFRIIDTELNAVSQRTAVIVSKKEAFWKKGNKIPHDSFFAGDEHYWLKIYDQTGETLIYQSRLAELIKITEPALNSSTTVSVIIPKNKINLRQDRKNEVTFRVRSTRVSFEGKTFRVCAGRPMEKLEEELWDVLIGIISGLVFSVLVLMAISYFVAGIILKPVRLMNDQAKDISEKHLNRRIPANDGPDEFNTLARTLNRVFERLEYAFVQQKQLLADASHELKTPLTMMRLALEARHLAPGETNPGLNGEDSVWLTEQVLRMERLVKNLLNLSSLEIKDTIKKDPVDVADLLASLTQDYRLLADSGGINLEVCLPRNLPVKGDAHKLSRAFSNILDNAVKYNFKGGKIKVDGDLYEGGLTIRVGNTGPGVAESETGKVFDQFYRVEQSRSLQHGGAGLGLAIAKRIIELHHGKVKFESKPETWTQVSVFLPRSDETS